MGRGKTPAINRKLLYMLLHFYLAFFMAISLGR